MKRILFTIFITTALFGSVQAETPEYFIARGRIVNKDLKSVPGSYRIRASIWNTADAPEEWSNDYLWRENQTVQILEDGIFEIRIGSRRRLPNPFDFEEYAFLQLDIKKDNDPFQILDPRPMNEEIDRINLLTLPSKKQSEARIISPLPPHLEIINPPYGEVTHMTDMNIKTNLVSLNTNVVKIDKNTQDNASKIDSLHEEVLELEEKLSVSLDAQSLQTNLNTLNKNQETLPDKEDSFIGDIQYVVDEQKLAAFDGNKWSRLANENDLKKSMEKTIQKTFYYHDEIIKVDQKREAIPGLFYWDKDESTYFVGMADGSLRSLFTGIPLREEKPIPNDWTDFRTVKIENMDIQKEKETIIEQSPAYGLQIQSSKNRENCSIAFPNFQFDGYENKTYEAVFYTGDMSGKLLLGLMDGKTLPSSKSLGKSTAIGVYMYVQEESNLLYGKRKNGKSLYDSFDLAEQWKPDTFYRITFRQENTKELKGLLTIDEVSKDDFNKPIKTIVNHEFYFDGLSDTLKPYLFGSGQSGYSFVAFRTY